MNATAPERIGRYELVAEIASGGMATVYLARLVGMGGFLRLLALKRLHPHLARDAEFVQMFLDEARLAALIHHPNVVSIQEVGESDGAYFLVMEYVEGDTLAQLLSQANADGANVPPGVAVRVMLDVLSGLHAAHELRDEQGQLTGLVHRDVSPQNILVGVDGISRITDFGVARAQSRLASSTRVGQLKGKIAYMAPEQASGEEGIDRRADVFAAGIVLWEVLTGRRLFKAENEAATLWRVVSEPIAPPSRYVFELDPRLSAVCMKALERDPSRRYQTCGEFADALERAGMESRCLSTAREAADTVRQVLGTRLLIQRDRIRLWMQENAEARGVMLTPHGSVLSSPGAGLSLAQLEEATQLGDDLAPLLERDEDDGRTSLPSSRRRRVLVLAGLGLLATLLVIFSFFLGVRGTMSGAERGKTRASAAEVSAGPTQVADRATELPAAQPPEESQVPPSPSSSQNRLDGKEPSPRTPIRRTPTSQERPAGQKPGTPPPVVDLPNPYR